ncbi:MAG: efflux RND transporter periplasmic adaptor subunit [Pedobacter sp.]|nr:efflux RND transporter periplasmic adaptor subunit [Pedobacter sp.]
MKRIIVAASLLVVGIASADTNMKAKQAAVQAPVKAAVLPGTSPDTVTTEVSVRVLLVAAREAKVSSQMNGRVISLPVKEGKSFPKGALLVEFDCEHQEAQLAILNAALAKSKVVLASRQELQRHAAVGEVDVQLATVDLDDAVARQKQAVALVRDCRILAPYNGYVVKMLVNQFENIGAGSPIMEIQESGRIKLEALVPSRSISWLKIGAPIPVHVDELDRDVTAVITSIGARIDSVSQTVGVSAEIKGGVSGLQPGMSGSAKIRKP